MPRTFGLAALAVLVVASTAWAAPKARLVDLSEVVSTTIKYKVSGRTKSKIIFCLGTVPGDSKSTSGGLMFTPIATTIAKMKAKKIGGSKLAIQVAIGKAGNSACRKILNQPTPQPTSAPGGSSNFDNNGDLTSQGKIAFGVPSGLSGNISAGRALTTSYCSCHQERIGHKFPTLRSSIMQPPMSFDTLQITDAMLANITAYLNRFNL